MRNETAKNRYYGTSLPFGNDTFKKENMGLLTVEQAMADYAVLIHYGGMLSAYMRFKYPNLVTGSIAASAPVLLLTPTADRSLFWKLVTKDFSSATPTCYTKYACQYMEATIDPVEGLAKASGLFYNGTDGTLPCYNIKNEFVACADQTGCGTGPDSLAWDFQACTEIDLVTGSTNVTDMFPALPWTEKMREDYCFKTWGVRPRNTWSLVEFWGSIEFSTAGVLGQAPEHHAFVPHHVRLDLLDARCVNFDAVEIVADREVVLRRQDQYY
ncbi:DPP2-like protein [Mya arenaria]|uniref:DPP2-like protein n=1 Tax=Mya arenaria TaxID=6604 RepID=A0ABY7G9G0_MYAAR|nr:DPP2-like protein [Mya arenaria]